MSHNKTTYQAFVDYEPTMHQGVCECGYRTGLTADFGDAVKIMNEHKDAGTFAAEGLKPGEVQP